MATVERRASHIEALLRAIAMGDRRITGIKRRRQQRRGHVAAATEALVRNLANAVGLLDLPPQQIARVLSGLRDACVALRPVASAQAPTVKLVKATKGAKALRPTVRSEKLRSPRGLQLPFAAQDAAVHLVMRKGRNVTAALKRAGLRWNGKRGYWHGHLTVNAAVTLQATVCRAV